MNQLSQGFVCIAGNEGKILNGAKTEILLVSLTRWPEFGLLVLHDKYMW